MATARRGLFATKPVEDLVAETEEEGTRLRRAVGALDLTALGLGAIIGTGIFVIIGEAIGDSGPSIVLSFVLAGLTALFSALAFAELASMIPVAGSAYTYSYATLGEIVAWIIGWDLILEYSLAVAAVSVGWGGYFNQFLSSAFGVMLPPEIASSPAEGGVLNLPAVVIVVAISALLIVGVKQSARTNSVMVLVKLAVLILFVVVGLTAFNPDNFTPFTPGGFGGTLTAAFLIFFAYIGFDAVSTTGEEVRRPQRDLPLGIVGSLVIATVLYIAVAVVATGLLPAARLAGQKAPLGLALSEGAGFEAGATVIAVGALIAITSVVLTLLYGQTRIIFSMSRDGLLPRVLARVSQRRRTPVYATLLFGTLIAVLAAFVPLTELADLVNIGTLFAFLIVNIGVIVLRRTAPDAPRGFRVPLVPLFPLVGAALCVLLLVGQGVLGENPGPTFLRFGIWLLIGAAIYAVYGRRHSRLRRGQAA